MMGKAFSFFSSFSSGFFREDVIQYLVVLHRPVSYTHLIAFSDGHYGPYAEKLARECGDFILRRADGVFAYQLAVVADDIDAGITQVVRGRDLLSSTPRQLYLYRLLNAAPPEYYHVPLLTAPDGRRLSKRDRDLDPVSYKHLDVYKRQNEKR